jgi:hypothetical protein
MGLLPYTLVSSDVGSVVVDVKGTNLELTANAQLSLGGGAAAGVVKLKTANSIELSALQAIDLGLVAAEHKFPSLAAEIEILKKLIDAQAAKLG